MTVTIGRTAWTDDDGTGTTGTVINNAAKTAVYDQIDTALALLLPLAGGTLTGLLTVNANIKFPATQVPVADVNTLDDYEEGTWTAAFATGTSGTITISTATCRYTKIGRVVHVSGFVDVASVSSPVGTLYITGLPFTNGSSNARAGVAIWGSVFAAGATTSLQAYIETSESRITVSKFAAGANSAVAGDVTAGTSIIFNSTYSV